MKRQPFRNPSGGAIDRSRAIRFRFDGRTYEGYAGDTLASALLANGVGIVARSFKYHRPRGIFAAGAEEPNALVQVGEGARAEPNLKATQIELSDGLVAKSQNCWPSRNFDIGALASFFSPLDFGGLNANATRVWNSAIGHGCAGVILLDALVGISSGERRARLHEPGVPGR